MATYDIVLKRTDPLRLAQATGKAPGFGHANLGPVFERLVPQVVAHLDAAGARPGLFVAWYEQPTDEGSVILHTGFDIGDQAVEGNAQIEIVDLPVVDVASLVHHGSMETVEESYIALVTWIEDRGMRISGRSRELYLEWDAANPERNVTEMQMPVSRS
jgi:effector-binding domain-containing protein